MKFTIGYGIDTLEDEVITLDENGQFANTLKCEKPEMPAGYAVTELVHTWSPDFMTSLWVIELDSMDELLNLARLMDCELTLERQPSEMRSMEGAEDLPEFAIVIGERIG